MTIEEEWSFLALSETASDCASNQHGSGPHETHKKKDD